MKTLADLVRQSALQFADLPALRSVGQARHQGMTYREVAESIRRFAAALRAAGTEAGARVLLYGEPGPDWLVAFFAILDAGLVAIPVAMETPLATAARLAGLARARAAIISDRTSAIEPLLHGVPTYRLERLRAVKPPADAFADSRYSDLAVLAFTSGSTSQPRAVELTQQNLLANLQSLLQVRRAKPGDVFLSMLPPAHLFEMLVGQLGPLVGGASIVYVRSLLPNRLVQALREEQITHALSVPALMDALYEEVLDGLVDAGVIDPARRGQSPDAAAARLQQIASESEREHLRAGVRQRLGDSLHTLVAGGAALDPAWAQLAQFFGLRLEVGYGLTEASPVVSLGCANDCPLGSVGRPLPGVEVRLGDQNEIQVRGPNVTRGYLADLQGTAAAFQDGWLRTGDRGYFDAEGFLYISGRIKEAMVTAAGETIYPEEVEPYYASPLFSDWCVTGLPGPQGNDQPTLFVIAASADVADGELQAAYERLRAAAPPRFRLHRMIRLTDPLPRTATGKIRRRGLAENWPLRG